VELRYVHDGIDIYAKSSVSSGFELYLYGELVDSNKSWLNIGLPFVQGIRLMGKPKTGSFVEVFLRNMGIGHRMEIYINGKLVKTKLGF
jgi:hypothetical protein